MLSFVIVLLAAVQQPYDLAVAGRTDFCQILVQAPPIERFEWTGFQPPRLTDQSDVQSLAHAPGGAVYALLRFGGIVEVRPDGSRRPIASDVFGLALVVARDGTIIVWQGTSVVVLGPDGAPRRTIATPFALPLNHSLSQGFDLAADQCTAFLPRANHGISRVNVCTGAADADYIIGNERYQHVRVLPDGGLLASELDWLTRFDAQGRLLRRYPGRARALALTRQGRAVWGSTNSCAIRMEINEIDLENGTILARRETRMTFIRSIVAYGGWTAALGQTDHHIADVPSLSVAGAALCVALLAALAVLRLR